MIDPSIWDDEDVGSLSDGAFRVFVACFSNADDEGRLEASPRRIKGIAFGFKDSVTIEDVENYLLECANGIRSFVYYSSNDRRIVELRNWHTYQKIDRPQASKLPKYDENSVIVERSTNDRRMIDDRSSVIEKNRIEQNRSSRSAAIAFDASVPGDPDNNPHSCFIQLINIHPTGADTQGISTCMKLHGNEITIEAIREGGLQGKDRWSYIAKDILPGIIEAHKQSELNDYTADGTYKPRKPSPGMKLVEANLELERKHLARLEAKRLEQQEKRDTE
jgi:hypothetical protein